MSRAIFIDRDGTLILDKEYLHDPAEVEFIDGAIRGLRKAVLADFAIIMVTNQSGVGRGYFPMEDVERVHAFIRKTLATAGITLLATYTAPEAPDRPSRGRKPSPQFLLDARDKFGIDLTRSYMVGDKLSDVQCGWNAAVKKSILVRTGEGKQVECAHREELGKALLADDLESAIDWILSDSLPGRV